jgi:hypothetical protein
MRIHDPELADHVARELFDRDLLVCAPASMPTGRRERALNAAMAAISPLL